MLSAKKNLEALPSSHDVQCACGAKSVIGSASYRRYVRRDADWKVEDWRCLRCISTDTAARLNYKKDIKAIDERFPVTCNCGAKSYGKWMTRYNKGEQWRCLPCASKFAYDTGNNKGTKGLKFVEHTLKDISAIVIPVVCEKCGNVRQISIGAVMTQSRQSVRDIWDHHNAGVAVTTHVCQACTAKEAGLKLRSTSPDFITAAIARHRDTYDYSNSVERTIRSL